VALARAQRAQTARTLIQTTDLPFAQVALGAGFRSVRQFNDTVRAVYARTPTELRRRARARRPASGAIELRLPYREPFDGDSLVAFLAARAIPGVEEVEGSTYRRTLSLEHGGGIVALTPAARFVRCELRLDDLRDLTAAVARSRRLLDLDADPVAVDEALGADPLLAPLVRRAPGRRVPGAVDGAELAVRAVLGQQVSVAGARTLAGRLTAALGEPLPERLADAGLTHAFPTASAIAAADPATLPLTRARAHALTTLCRALADGSLALDPGADRAEARERLLTLPGIGPWTVEYVAMRALGDPDAFPATDLGVRKAIERAGHPGDPRAVTKLSERWRPWRAYAVQHLWASLNEGDD
jgi:AraC family transcriptional regulator, regulatory protein of adaptative response / DNA-3-methyladenine glycosylase II